MSKFWMLLSSMVLVFSFASSAHAQGAPAPAGPKPPARPVKVQIVISRFDGEKKVASLPYFLFGTDDGAGMNFNLEVQVPVPGGPTGPNYKGVGTHMTCAVKAADGKFNVDLTLAFSSLLPDKTIAAVPDLPAFQSFTMHNALVLSEGQTVQYASVVDPVTGQVTKVDATLTMVK